MLRHGKGCKIHIEKDTQERDPCKATGRKGKRGNGREGLTLLDHVKKVSQFDDETVRSKKAYLQQLP